MPASAPLSAALLWLLPAMFALHETEEALFLPPWLRRNRDALARRFPRLANLLPASGTLTRSRFAAMAAEEGVLLLAGTLYAWLTGNCRPWLALFIAFGTHLLLHLGQWIAAARYVPLVVTSCAGLLYCGWGVRTLASSGFFTFREWMLCGAAGCAAAAVNLFLLHRLTARFAGSGRRG